ncbi:MAG TPA: prepilin-type N-terminal cleavage/methylation domain-containing protein [Planctomycetota bacterium]|nr:prepilin-type N-terminal cleavage/methylation domain-containing protein [Planctomycetota bacterium]
MQHRRAGFSLIEFVVVIAVIAIIAAIAIPNLQRAKLTANEASALITMRALSQAQNQVVTSPQIDSNGDGQPEFGYFAELAGLSVTRVDSGGVVGPGGPSSKLVPNALLAALGNVQGSVVTYGGYVFQVWLPAATAAGLTPGIPEDATGGKLTAPFPDPVNCASTWCAYGWPLALDKTGTPCYFVNEQGQILMYTNRGAVKYTGLAGGPNFDAALSVAGNMKSAMGINGVAAVDGNLWVVVR